jgi:hypothetical protein
LSAIKLDKAVEVQGDALDFVFGLIEADFYVRANPYFICIQSPPSLLASARQVVA